MATNRYSELIRRYFAAYEDKNREGLEEILSDDFSFSSPDDPMIDKEKYFERCWPVSEEVRKFTIEKLFESKNEVFVRYEAETNNGSKFRNTEFFTFERNKIKRVEVYYGSQPVEAGSGLEL